MDIRPKGVTKSLPIDWAWSDLGNLHPQDKTFCTALGSYVITCYHMIKHGQEVDVGVALKLWDQVPADRRDDFLEITRDPTFLELIKDMTKEE